MKRKIGFTLIELLITILIVVIVLGIITAVAGKLSPRGKALNLAEDIEIGTIVKGLGCVQTENTTYIILQEVKKGGLGEPKFYSANKGEEVQPGCLYQAKKLVMLNGETVLSGRQLIPWSPNASTNQP